MEKHFDESGFRLLRRSSEYIGDELGESGIRQRRSVLSWLRINALSLGIFLLLLYIAILQTIELLLGSSKCAASSHNKVNNEHIILPKESLRYEERLEWHQPQLPWHQGPSDALDDVWDDLLYSLNIRVANHELDILSLNKTNRVQVTGGNGDDYAGVLGVYHHLHCLNNIRRLLSWDYYGPKLAGEKHMEGFSPEHSNHCIDSIRQALMCHANTGIYTTEWDEKTGLPSRIITTNSVTTCVRWDMLSDWARQRALRPGQYKYKAPRPVS
ncbi:hypothetical protein GGR54DRAFT_184508 [Hypoxylon sp. NC1633]|nr:hypothetical protein GGR54DRAFT_184508 [Hypoxylon sp. NC1633]